MSDFIPTERQRQALDLSASLSVTATAGSGKTSILVQRYLDLFKANPNLSLDSVLAITFTEKATAEMKERVRSKLVEFAESQETDAQRWRKLLDQLAFAAISTIHSLCASLLREFPVEAGIDPSCAVMDEIEARFLLEQSRDLALLRLSQGKNTPAGQALQVILREWSRRKLETLLALLSEKRLTIANLMEKWCETDSDALWKTLNLRIEEEQLNEVRAFVAAPHVVEASEDLEALSCNSPDDKLAIQRDSVVSALGRLQDAGHISSARLDLALICEIDLRSGSKASWGKENLTLAKKLLKQIRDGARALPFREIGEPDRRSMQLVQKLFLVFREVLRTYQEQKALSGVLDFDDLEERARSLLKNHPHLRQKIQKRYRFVLVDEFQDTNFHQWDIIRQIACEEKTIHPGRLFIVGDPVQSIYGFRNAQVEVFGHVRGLICNSSTTDGREVTLNDNFRSTRAVVDFVNHVFTKIIGAGREDWNPSFEPLITKRDDPVEGTIRILLSDTDNSTAEKARSLEAASVARCMRWMLQDERPIIRDRDTKRERPVEARDIAILLRRRTFLPALEQALRQYSVPFFVAGGIGFYERQEVRDIANVLRFLANQSNSIALAGVLRSTLFGFSDEQLLQIASVQCGDLWSQLQVFADNGSQEAVYAASILSHWLRLSGRVTVAELIWRVLEDTGGWASYAAGNSGKQTIANLQKLIDTARVFSGSGRPLLCDFVNRLNDLLEREAREGQAAVELGPTNAVSILTIHAAKGLEFPVVFVPDLNRPAKPRQSSSLLIDPGLGAGTKVTSLDDYKPVDTAMYSLIARREQRRNLAEEKRLFYVATTRARDHLVLSSGYDAADLEDFSQHDTWTGWLLTALDANKIEEGSVTCNGQEVHIHTSAEAFGGRAEVDQSTSPLHLSVENRLSPQEMDKAKSTFESCSNAMPLAEARETLSLTPSQMEVYQRCPREYYLRHVLHAPEGGLLPSDSLVHHSNPDNSGAAFGNAVHRLMSDIQRSTNKIPRRFLDACVLIASEGNARDKVVLRKRLRHAINSFRSSPFGMQWINAAQEHRELPFSMKIADAVIHGQIDLLFRSANGWVVLDYKTDRIEAAEKDSKASEYLLQLSLYSLATARMMQESHDLRAVLFFTEIGETWETVFDPQSLASAEKEIAAIIEGIRAERFDPAHKENCEYCPMSHLGFCRN